MSTPEDREIMVAHTMQRQHLACILHGEFHPPEEDCAEALMDWFFAHWEMDQEKARNLYQLEVEAIMLASLMRPAPNSPDGGVLR